MNEYYVLLCSFRLESKKDWMLERQYYILVRFGGVLLLRFISLSFLPERDQRTGINRRRESIECRFALGCYLVTGRCGRLNGTNALSTVGDRYIVRSSETSAGHATCLLTQRF